jgi:hypothetical protein
LPRSAYSIFCRERSRIVLSISSTWWGRQLSASTVAEIAAWVLSKCPTAYTVFFGFGTRSTTARVAMTSVPSAPTTNFARSNGFASP